MLSFFRTLVLTVLALFSLASRASAVTVSQTHNPQDITCEQRKADVLAGRLSDADSAFFYMRGKWMGVTCMRPDVVKAFELFRKAGLIGDMQAALDDIVAKANTGSPRAQSDLDKLKKAGLIIVHPGSNQTMVELKL